MLKFIGHVLQGLIFLGSGYSKITDPAGTVSMIKGTLFPKLFNELTGGAIKLDYTVFVQAIGAAMVLFGLMLVLGIFRRFAATMLVLILIPITAFVHVNLNDPAKTDLHNMIHVMKNLSIIGGLLVVAFAPHSHKAVVDSPRRASPINAKKNN